MNHDAVRREGNARLWYQIQAGILTLNKDENGFDLSWRLLDLFQVSDHVRPFLIIAVHMFGLAGGCKAKMGWMCSFNAWILTSLVFGGQLLHRA